MPRPYRNVEERAGRFFYAPAGVDVRRGLAERVTLGSDFEEAVRRADRLNSELDRRRAEFGERVDGLFDAFLASPAFDDLSEKTRASYRQAIGSLRKLDLDGRAFGFRDVRSVRPRDVARLYESMRFPFGRSGRETLAYANVRMRVARLVWSWARVERDLSENPFSAQRLRGTPSRAVVWTSADVEAVVRTATETGEFSIAAAVMLCVELGQRIGDVRHLDWTSYDGERVVLVQSKTSTAVSVPVSSRLRIFLESVPVDRRVGLILGREYSEAGIRAAFARVRARAGVSPDLRLPDLRRTALTELSDAGATTDELMSVSGHKTRAVVDVYSRKTASKADSAVEKRDSLRRSRK